MPRDAVNGRAQAVGPDWQAHSPCERRGVEARNLTLLEEGRTVWVRLDWTSSPPVAKPKSKL
jgi:hypothetical protein